MKDVNRITSIILAAGEGKRMYSKTPKVLHKVCGMPMLEHVIDCAKTLSSIEPIVVVGHGADLVMKSVSGVRFVLQQKQLGTGHALMQADEYIEEGDILVLYGDTPLLKAETVEAMYEIHKANDFGATVLTADMDNPTGYGRILRNDGDLLSAIVEERDADHDQKQIKEVNSGIYFFKGAELKSALKNLDNNNAQGEYYLTDVVAIMKERGLNIGIYKIGSAEEIMGVNNRLQLSQAEAIMRQDILEKHMLAGVTIIDPMSTYIEKKVKIDMDVTILPGCILEGNTTIGEDCVIGPETRIKNSQVGTGVSIQKSVVMESAIGDESSVGPFAYLRPGNKIGKHCKIGDFVEMKNSNFGDYSKASHLTYVGDGDVGSNVNLGCGVVFVNYDGKNKNRSVVEDNSFIGCNVNLIAPVTVKEGAYVAAGTTITKEVPKDSLAIGRVRQEIKEDWAKDKK